MSITYKDMQRLSELELLSLTLHEPSNSTAVQGLLNSMVGLDELLLITEQELKEIAGLEGTKTYPLLASLELAKRIYAAPTRVKVPLTSPDAVAEFLMPQLRFRHKEFCIGLYLDRKNCLKFVETISIGSIASSIVHPREVFKPGVKRSAASIILAHNHPSGDPAPSKEDISITKRLVEAGQVIGIDIIDHIIIGDNVWSSLRQSGHM